MTDYSKSVIYKIHKDGICYIGSTNDENQRKRDHKSSCNNVNNKKCFHLKVYQHIRENGGWDNWTFEVIEEFPCENRKQLEERERYYYDLLNPELNGQRPSITIDEIKIRGAKYYQEHREERKIIDAKYYQEQKVKNKIYNCICGGHYTTGGYPRHCRRKKHIAFIEKNK